MNEKNSKLASTYPSHHIPFFARPHVSRRNFFGLAAAGVTGGMLSSTHLNAQVVKAPSVTLKNSAKNVVFVLLTGAPSHTDTFDLKMVDGTTPKTFNPATINGMLWNTGVFPKLANAVPDLAVIRSVRSWNLQHTLGQMWVQIGRNPGAVLGAVAPNIGSLIAIEKVNERSKGQVFPGFLSFNNSQVIGSGFLSSAYEPFKTVPTANGLPNTTNPDGAGRLDDKYNLLMSLDSNLRVDSPYGEGPGDYGDFYNAARGLMYNPVVSKAFSYSPTDSARYGSTGFGNSLLVSKQVLEADQGTRYIQVTLGGWDMHTNIYAANGTSIFSMGKQLDDGLSEFIKDLKANGRFNDTLIVVMGEFGRTVGAITAAGGRDHFLQQFCIMAGGGIKGGQVIGSTDARGGATLDPGWSEQRDVRAEDIEATIYSAMGVNYLSIRYDDPFKRGFEYVPGGNDGVYKPINELWG